MAFIRSMTVNLRPGGFAPVIHVNQYDAEMIQYQFTVLEGEIMPNFPINTTVKLQGHKDSGFGFSVPGYLDGNVATITITATMTEEAGKNPCELVFENGASERIGTVNMLMIVEKSPHPEGITDGDAETAKTLMEQMEAAVNDAEAAAANAQEVVAQVLPIIETRSEPEDVLDAEAQKIYIYTVPMIMLDIVPAADGITSVFFTAAEGCGVSFPRSVNIPPGIPTQNIGSSQIAIYPPAGLKYELNIFNNYLLMEAWE